MPFMTRTGDWHDTLGETMLIAGIIGMLGIGIGASRCGHT